MQHKPISVLLVDDDEDDYLIVKGLLSKVQNTDIHLEWVSDVEIARTKIEESTHDVYLIDYRLGPLSGIDLLGNIDLPSRPQPFIILTGAGDNKIEESAMRMGVADYLVKGTFDAELLSRVLRYSIQRKLDEAKRIEHYREINDSKDEFIALASHQLRTPATAVKQYVGMLLEGYAGDLAEQQLSFLRSAYNSNERQLKVVDDILKIAQLDLKKINLHHETLSIQELLEELITDLRPIFAEKEQQITTESCTESMICKADRLHLGMAISNIIDNASKYSNNGTKIHVTLKEARNNTLQILIRDQGVGINETDYNKLFVKFSRIPNPLSVIVGGTGLGLYWSSEVVKLHGGTITVSSKPEKGTTFTITLPRS